MVPTPRRRRDRDAGSTVSAALRGRATRRDGYEAEADDEGGPLGGGLDSQPFFALTLPSRAVLSRPGSESYGLHAGKPPLPPRIGVLSVLFGWIAHIPPSW